MVCMMEIEGVVSHVVNEKPSPENLSGGFS